MRDHGLELFRIVYVSRAVLPVLAKFEATVQEIQAEASNNNQRLGITGMLLAHSGWFIQTLEGPRRNVSIAFGAIARDLRHAQLEVLKAGPAPSRLFGEWAMHAQSVTPASAPLLEALGLATDFDPFQVDGDIVLRLMSAFASAPLQKAS